MDENKIILEPWDWRYSATIVGLQRFLRKMHKDKQVEDIELCITSDEIIWGYSDEQFCFDKRLISEDIYLEYVEKEFEEDIHHKVVEKWLQNGEVTDEEEIKKINEKLSANTILKKCFKKLKYDGSNRTEILNCIEDNRKTLIHDTFKNKTNLYRNYCNEGMFLKPEKECCRLKGYYLDMPRKGKSQSYNFNKSNFTGEDNYLFDFIPFAFAGHRDFYFINDNINLNNLFNTNDKVLDALKEEQKLKYEENKTYLNGRRIFFKAFLTLLDYLKSNVEVIHKNMEVDYFETVYIRTENIDVFKKLKKSMEDPNKLTSHFGNQKITDNYYIDTLEVVVNNILNKVLLDELINFFLKRNTRDVNNFDSFTIKMLIDINIWLKEDLSMNEKNKKAYRDAKRIVSNEKIEDNKLKSFRQKLISSIVFEDYDQFCKILLNLSNYAGTEIGTAYDLFEDFEANKELAYTFVNSLYREDKKEVNKEEK